MTSQATIRRLLAAEDRDPREVAMALKFCLRTLRKLEHGKRDADGLRTLFRAHGIDPRPGAVAAA